MSANQDLREALEDDQIRWAAKVDHADPDCPGCGNAGVPTTSDYREEFLECVTPGCRTLIFSLYRDAANDRDAEES